MLTKTDDQSNTLFSDRYQQTYHSTFGALTESTHVFLHGAGVQQRLIEKRPTRVLEIGFGLGLNCLVCADCASKNQTRLEYVGVEHEPISADVLRDLSYADVLQTRSLADDLLALLSTDPAFGISNPVAEAQDSQIGYALSGELGNDTQCQLLIADTTSPELIAKLQQQTPFDAIFLDAFSPEVNPECWSESFLAQLTTLLATHGRLATYCVKGAVRRNLQAAGFRVHKYPGPKGKREVLWAELA